MYAAVCGGEEAWTSNSVSGITCFVKQELQIYYGFTQRHDDMFSPIL
jgi:hypothetical protein